ncbi:phosphate acetyltransferase [Psychrobacter sp. FDAARGOS_221]|uniref:phosphate acetyltransferase n=1 Tax=Psychrobacter sp. FDAARGOS_221 TaxID=1975705 RepID=UPI000BB598BF|nr:phosphate acetyltransferase [Psychrobacter sp. FDAARGOS_221]PNK60407.1 phosphate acetyltransferase [Psychrobacter sp. FDAARGOS_221]
MQTILLVPTGRGVGLTSAALGLIKSLETIGVKASFSKPFLQDDSHDSRQTLDSSSELAQQVFGFNPPESISRDRLERMMNVGNTDDLMEEVVSNIQNAVTDQDSVVICEGMVPTEEANYAAQLNYALAIALDAKVIFVSMADLENPKNLAEKMETYARVFGGLASERTLGCILMRAQNMDSETDTNPVAPGKAYQALDASFIQTIQSHSPKFATDAFHLIGVVPFSNHLSVQRAWDVGEGLSANWLNIGDAKKRRVLKTSLTARTISRVGEVFSKGTLIVTPGDRDDLLLASAMAAVNGIEMAGIVLTGDIVPNDTVFELCQPALEAGLPIMSVPTNSFETVTDLTNLSNEIPKDDVERAQAVTSFVAAHLDLEWLKKFFERDYKPRLSPSAFRNQVVRKAQGAKMRVVLPEGEEPRTIEAAAICQTRGIAKCVLLGNAQQINKVAKEHGVKLPEDIEIIDPSNLDLDKYIKAFVERRKGKATEEQAAKELEDTVVLGTTMLYLDEVDGLVSGAIHTTANTVRPAFQLIKTAPQYSLVSSIFFMLLPEQVVVYGDCAINPDPNAEQLAEIAIQSAASAKAFGIEPKVAMISYSTGASGTGDDVEKVKQATQIVRERAPDLLVDGPLQYDAASVLSVGKQKAPDSPVAGQANVFIFPDLNTGNTTYKAVQRSANVVSVGPMLQGLNKPVNDLSRGALVDDIVYTIALTAIQASSPDV